MSIITPGMWSAPAPVTAVVALEPVYNVLMSMAALREPENYGGLDDWVLQTASQMEPVLRQRHHLLFEWLWLDGLTNAVARGPATASFPAYLADLAQQEPTTLRNTLLYWIAHSPHARVGNYEYLFVPPPTLDLLLSDVAYFMALLDPKELIDEKRRQDAETMHALFNQPAELQTLLVTHLQTMWERFLAAEWQRIAPKLQATVDAFQAVPLAGLTMLEAMQVVTGRDLSPAFRLNALAAYRHVRFIPHIHNGPYILWFGDEEELRIGFAAHRAPDTPLARPAFDLSTLVNRHKALADETRLAILLALRETKELSTQEVIDQFALDKSAASRHLRQLVATSLIEERREEGAKKIYRINKKAIDELIGLLATLA